MLKFPDGVYFRSLTWQLILGSVAAVLVIFAWSGVEMRLIVREVIVDNLSGMSGYWVDSLAGELRHTLGAVERSLGTIARADAANRHTLEALLREHPRARAAALRRSGATPSAAGGRGDPLGLLARCGKPTPHWTPPYPVDGDLAISYCLPLPPGGLVTLQLDLAWLPGHIAPRLDSDTLPEPMRAAQAILLDPGSGRWLVPSPRELPRDWLSGIALAPLSNGDDPLAMERHWDGQQLMIYTQLPDTHWLLGLYFPKAGISALQWRYIRIMLRSMIRDMLLICLAVTLISRRTTRPLRGLIANTEDIAAGNLDTHLPDTRRRDEVGRLTTAFRRMRDALKDRIRELQETTAARQRLESELAIAGQIQRDMVPRVEILPQPGRPYELSALLQPARQVGGDFYDFFPLEDRRLCLIIGDVAGKGVPASLLMARTVTLIRASARQTQRPTEILQVVNRELCRNNEECRFVTLFCGVLDLQSGMLDYASGGHDPPLLARGSAVSAVDLETGPPLGLDEEAQFPGYRQQLERDDLLLLYTDGITEAMNPQDALFSDQRLFQVMARHGNNHPARLIRAIRWHLKRFIQDAPPSDDLTLLALRYLPSNPFLRESRTVEWQIRINHQLTELARVRLRLGELLQEEHLAVESIEDAQLIVEEVMANIIQHGQVSEAGHFIDLTVTVGAETLSMRFEDRAAPFNPLTEVSAPDLDMDDEQRAEGGLGLFLVRELAHHLDYRYEAGSNILTVEQRIQHRH